MKVKVILERGKDGYYVAPCLSLRSCWPPGKTRDEALRNIREAVELYWSRDRHSCQRTRVMNWPSCRETAASLRKRSPRRRCFLALEVAGLFPERTLAD